MFSLNPCLKNCSTEKPSAGNGEAKSPEKKLRPPSQAQGEEITKMARAETLEKSPKAAIHAFAAGRLTLYVMESPMRTPKYSDEKIRQLCARAIAAEGEEFRAAMADLRKFIRRASQNVENETLGSAFKLSRVIQASRKAAAKKEDDEQEQKQAA